MEDSLAVPEAVGDGVPTCERDGAREDCCEPLWVIDCELDGPCDDDDVGERLWVAVGEGDGVVLGAHESLYASRRIDPNSAPTAHEAPPSVETSGASASAKPETGTWPLT